VQTVSAVVAPRNARVGDRVPTAVLGPRPTRRLDATALLIPGRGGIDAYRTELAARAADLAAWDGLVVTTAPDDGATHRVLVVDRYRQVYALYDSADPVELPSARELEEWFRFLATACPECGVIDDPTRDGPTP
jgi:hypothetical protein